jgi:hypothetical protein
MTDLAGFGVAGWLPASVLRAQALEEQAERREARAAERLAGERAEARRSASLAMYAAGCEARGEAVPVMAMARGEVAGRDFADVLADAAAMADRQDAIEAARARRETGTGYEILPYPVAPPALAVGEEPQSARAAPVTAAGRELANRYRRFAESRDAARRAATARTALEDDFPQLRDQSHRRRSAPTQDASCDRGRDASPAGNYADRIRSGGPIVSVW